MSQQHYNRSACTWFGSVDIFYHRGGYGTGVIVYIATSYELQATSAFRYNSAATRSL